MSRDLVFKETRRDWSRSGNLTAAPLIPPAPESPAAAAMAATVSTSPLNATQRLSSWDSEELYLIAVIAALTHCSPSVPTGPFHLSSHFPETCLQRNFPIPDFGPIWYLK